MAAPSALLSIINRASDELSLGRVTSVATTTDPQIRNLLALLHAEGRFLMEDYEWSFLRTLYTFPTVIGTATYAVASDFDRYIPDTFWDRTNDTQLIGPDSPQADRWRQESTAGGAGLRKYYRQIGSNIQIYPTPTAVETIVYEYVSNKWVRSSAAAAQTEFLVDTDTSLFDPYLLILGLKWRFRSGKGFGAEAAWAEYERKLTSAKNKDNSGETLNMSPPGTSQFIGMENVPDTGFGV